MLSSGTTEFEIILIEEEKIAILDLNMSIPFCTGYINYIDEIRREIDNARSDCFDQVIPDPLRC